MNNEKDISKRLQVSSALFSCFLILFLSVLALVLPTARNLSAAEATDLSVRSLAELAIDSAPWMHMEAYSEQRHPVYLGATPREMELGLPPADKGLPILPKFMQLLGEKQAKAIRSALTKKKLAQAGAAVEFEAWPARDDAGRLTWTFARFRISSDPKSPWRWLDDSLFKANHQGKMTPPLLPATLHPASAKEFSLIFDEFSDLPGLYDKPAFADCVWTSGDNAAPLPKETPAWLPVARMAELRQKREIPGEVCRQTPSPARLNGKPVAFTLSFSGNTLVWPVEIGWKKPNDVLPVLHANDALIKKWPFDFTEAYKKDLFSLDGEGEAVYPISKRKVRFTARSGADPNNQLGLLIEYLEERYRELGIETRRQDFIWRGIPSANLIAVIPGALPYGSNRPVLMGDHIDTAYCGDIYDRTGRRVSAPGADDNASATAVLLRAAEILKDSKPLHDIWLVHFTSEEFPPDDLGARFFLALMMKEKRDISGLVLMDLIGWRAKDDNIYQVNTGDNEASLKLAAVAFDAARAQKARYKPRLRTRFDPRSYLYNTDGLQFSDMGYPVILINEKMNRLENLERTGYHDTQDTSRKIDWGYVTAVAKVAIETAARLSQMQPGEIK